MLLQFTLDMLYMAYSIAMGVPISSNEFIVIQRPGNTDYRQFNIISQIIYMHKMQPGTLERWPMIAGACFSIFFWGGGLKDVAQLAEFGC